MTRAVEKILIVDDDPCIISLIALHVEMAGYEPVSALDGIAALQLAPRERPRAVILDLMLPEIDGWEVCRSIKRDERTAGIPVLILSALSDRETREKAFIAGADGYMTKPFSPKELIAKISGIVGRRHCATGREGPAEETGRGNRWKPYSTI